MSIRVMSRVWDDGPDDREELLVLLALADHANDAGECWPSIPSIAAKARLSERGVQKIIRRLEQGGYLITERGGGRGSSNLYRIKNPEHHSPNDVHPEPYSVNTSAETPNGRAKTPNRGSPEPSITIKESSKSKARDRCAEILEEVLSPKTAAAFIAHRKAKRAKLTEHAAQLIVGKLRGCADPDAVATESICNGWTGVFPKEDARASQSEPRLDVAAYLKEISNAR